jgi:hypothetical protein
MKTTLTVLAVLVAFAAGLCINARYDLRIINGNVPVRFDRWTGRSVISYPTQVLQYSAAVSSSPPASSLAPIEPKATPHASVTYQLMAESTPR